MVDGDSDPAGLLLPAVVDRSLIEEGSGMFVHPNKKARTWRALSELGLYALEVWVEFTMVDFMIWKGVALVIGATICGFWLGLTGR